MTLVWTALAALGVLAVLGVPLARRATGRWVVYGGSLLACLVLLWAGLAALDAPPETLVLPVGLPWTGAHLRLDALSGAFLVLIGVGGAGASLFAIGYGRHEHAPARVLPFYPAFLAGMALVVLADDAFTFLFAWELMSLASWALVMADHAPDATARAGFVYLVMATFSGLALLLAFGLLAGAQGGYVFAQMRAAHPAPWIAGLAFALALVGTGAKAGLVPLQVWLPLAHPAAPSHVSALMSGVMTKVAVYGFLRIVFDLLGAPLWWQAVLVLLLGGITAVYGVLQAVMQRDLKRLLACSTIENIGIVFVAIGLAMAFRANGIAAGAALALTAALFHCLNHTLFKSLLFQVSGAVLVATGTRDLERLGGLIHRLPVTAVAALVGCAAIAALPPLNGFASEWLIFQAVLLRPDLPQWGLKLMLPVDGALLALAAALAAACFVRAYGIVFLGRPRSEAAAAAHEVDRISRAAMLVFAALCALAGLFPGLVVDALAPVVQPFAGGRMPVQGGEDWLTLVPVDAARGTYNGLLVGVFILASAALTAAVVHRLGSRALRRAPAWDCGFPDPRPDTQYSGDSFAQPLRRVFGTLAFHAQERVDMPRPGDMRAAVIEKSARDPVWDLLYAPVGTLVARVSDAMNVLQFLTIRRYLGFVFAMLIVLLLALTVMQ
ncbi:MAG: hydrogenase 4 subunit B [Rhodospirillales bacterium]|nr:hydrogenase 4 subunit B [Rhodospirillales bacterium]